MLEDPQENRTGFVLVFGSSFRKLASRPGMSVSLVSQSDGSYFVEPVTMPMFSSELRLACTH